MTARECVKNNRVEQRLDKILKEVDSTEDKMIKIEIIDNALELFENFKKHSQKEFQYDLDKSIHYLSACKEYINSLIDPYGCNKSRTTQHTNQEDRFFIPK